MINKEFRDGGDYGCDGDAECDDGADGDGDDGDDDKGDKEKE